MLGHNPLLEARLASLRDSLDALANAVDANLHTLLRHLTCDETLFRVGPLPEIDALARATRERCLMLFTREHPVAGDLKFAMAALRVGHDYERIDELANALNKRIERLRGTPMREVLQDMTGVMADILKLHDIVRRTWRNKGEPTPNLRPEVQTVARSIQAGIAAIQNTTMEAIARGTGSPEITVELVLACRHVKRIATLMESIPDETHSFDKTDVSAEV